MESNSPKGCARAESGSKPLQGLVGPAGDVWKVPGAPGAMCAFPQQYTPAGASRPALSFASWFPPPELAQSSACVSPSRRSVCSLFPKDTHCFLLHHPSPQQVPSRPPRGRWQPNRLQELAQRLATLNLTRAGVVALAFESHGHKKRRDLLAEEQPGQADAAQAPEVNGCSSVPGEDTQCLMWKCLYLEQYIVTFSNQQLQRLFTVAHSPRPISSAPDSDQTQRGMTAKPAVVFISLPRSQQYLS